MDRVLTMLFPRLKYDGYGSRREPRKTDLTVAEFQREFLEHPEWFDGFAEHPEIVRCWIETELMDLVNRGKPAQAVAAPRPLHGNTYKFRNSRHARDYGAAEHLYWLLYHARHGRGQAARDALRRFFFPGVDLLTDRHDPSSVVDVETQALLRLDQQVTADMRIGHVFVARSVPIAGDIVQLKFVAHVMFARHLINAPGGGVSDTSNGLGESAGGPDIEEGAAAAIGHPRLGYVRPSGDGCLNGRAVIVVRNFPAADSHGGAVAQKANVVDHRTGAGHPFRRHCARVDAIGSRPIPIRMLVPPLGASIIGLGEPP